MQKLPSLSYKFYAAPPVGQYWIGANTALQITKVDLVDAVQDELNNDTLDAQALAELLGGGKGIAVVLRTLTFQIAATAVDPTTNASVSESTRKLSFTNVVSGHHSLGFHPT